MVNRFYGPGSIGTGVDCALFLPAYFSSIKVTSRNAGIRTTHDNSERVLTFAEFFTALCRIGGGHAEVFRNYLSQPELALGSI